MIALCLLVALMAPPADDAPKGDASTEALTAEAIIERATGRNALGFEAGQASVRMVLQDKAGKRKTYAIKSATLLGEDARRRSLIRFQEPAEVRGSAFLLLQGEAVGADDMYLYLPALKRTRRVAGAQRKGAFMGSDFSYSDMESRDLKAATYTRKDDVELEGVKCHHVVAVPKDDQYTRIELWARITDFLPQQIKFFGADDQLVKVYRLHEARIIDGVPVATKSQMWTKATGHNTFLFVDSVDRKTALSAADFTPQRLATP
ncbi:MAG: outer membrane lipoprotein-sorting protein [Bradymonadia bacterium]